MAGLTGLEPATSCVTGRRSNQLNYNPAGGRAEHVRPEPRQNSQHRRKCQSTHGAPKIVYGAHNLLRAEESRQHCPENAQWSKR